MIRAILSLVCLLWFVSPANAQTRTLISVPTTWYVGTQGNDANDCSTPALACQTIQHALDTLIAKYDFAAIPTLKLLADGGSPTFYRARVNLNRWVGSAQWFVISGDPANNGAVVVAPQNDHSIASSHTPGAPWLLTNFAVQESPGYYGCIADFGAQVNFQNMNWGGSGIAHIFGEFGSLVEVLIGNETISGGAQMHIQLAMGAIAVYQPVTITFLNSPSFTHFAAIAQGSWANFAGLQSSTGAHYSGSPWAWGDGTGGIVAPSNGYVP